MNIMIVNSYYYPEVEGGAEYSVKLLAEILVKLGHEVHVICTGNDNCEETIKGVNVYRIRSRCLVRAKECHKKRFITRKIHRLLDIYNPFNFRIFDRYIKSIRPDVIHSNCLYDFSPVVWSVARHNNVRIIHTIRDYYLICEHSNMIKKNTNLSCLRPSILCRIYRIINYMFSINVDVVTAPSRFTLDTVCNAGLFKNAKKKVVFNATDINIDTVKDIVEKRKNSLKEKNIFTFVFAGTLTGHKGITWLVDCFKKINDQYLRLVICGKGSLQSYVEEATREDSRIDYRGFLNQKELQAVLLSADALICPSIWNEPFGRVVIDAYQCGIPVIATNVGALPTIVKDRETGLVVEKENDRELENAIQLMYLDKILYKTMLEGVYKICDEFSLVTQAYRFLELYTRI